MESVNIGMKSVKCGMKAANSHLRFSARCNGKTGYAYDTKIHLKRGGSLKTLGWKNGYKLSTQSIRNNHHAVLVFGWFLHPRNWYSQCYFLRIIIIASRARRLSARRALSQPDSREPAIYHGPVRGAWGSSGSLPAERPRVEVQDSPRRMVRWQTMHMSIPAEPAVGSQRGGRMWLTNLPHISYEWNVQIYLTFSTLNI